MNADFQYSDEQFADVQLLRYRLKGFENLTIKQKLFIYFLSQATLAGRDITTDQFGKYNLLVRKVFECIYRYGKLCRTQPEWNAFETYLKQVWFANGIYHHYSYSKFTPAFSPIFFHKALQEVEAQLVEQELCTRVDELYSSLKPILFDADYLPLRVNQRRGDDLVATSACNYYEGVSQAEAEAFYANQKEGRGEELPSFGLNSKLVKKDGTLKEEVWCADGMYGDAIKRIIGYLEQALPYCESDEQRTVVELLIAYYRTGDLKLFDDYSIAWVQNKGNRIDFINGFIEVYGDPLGLKASWEGIVHYVDKEATHRTEVISEHAQWFEDHSPVASEFKRTKVQGVSATVVTAAMLGGDEYPSTAIGINLPNAAWIRSRYGSKSVTISNLTEAYQEVAHGNGFLEEFVIDEQTRNQIQCYGNVCDDLHTDLHECVGHGSGQLLPGTDADALKVYGNVIEEARADLFGLYYMADPKLVELGLLPNDEAYKSQYYTYLMNGLMTQLARIELGKSIEEAHMRNRALIARWVLAHGDGALELITRAGKTYLQINRYEALRPLFAKLLAEIQRIKSEGDFAAAQALVENYAVHIDSELHKEIKERYGALHIAPFKGFINPQFFLIKDGSGTVVDVKVDYTEGYAEQMLRYSTEFGML